MDINGIHSISTARNISAPQTIENARKASSVAQNRPICDEIEISTSAEKLSAVENTQQAAKGETVRYELVNRIREEIAAGTYDTPERFNIAMERLIESLG